MDLGLPLRTERASIRPLRPADAAPLTAYRNEPDVARYQSWALPYPRAAADALVHEAAAGCGPVAGRGVQLALDVGGELVGDVYVALDDPGTTARIGVTLAPAAQGRGIAAEAVGALIDALLGAGVHRVVATCDPDNLASAMLLERLGFRYEGRAVAAVEVRGRWVDDDGYALLATDRAAWLARPSEPPAHVELVVLDDALARAASALATHRFQERFVSPVLRSFRDAMFAGTIDPEYPADSGRQVPIVPWLRGVRADGELVGFVMLAWPTEPGQAAYLWRLLVDRRHQRRRIGSRILSLVLDAVRATTDARSLLVSWVPGRGGPEPFYRRHGFVPTGDVDDGEVVARLVW